MTVLSRIAAVLAPVLALAGCATAPVAPAPPRLGTLWLWQETQTSDGGRRAPVAPQRYTLRFLDDGRLEVRADCNRGTGRYRIEPGGGIMIGAFSISRIACSNDSLDRPFLQGVASAVEFSTPGPDEFRLLLANERGTMRFLALPPL